MGLRIRNANGSRYRNGRFIAVGNGIGLFFRSGLALCNRNLVSVGLGFGFRQRIYLRMRLSAGYRIGESLSVAPRITEVFSASYGLRIAYARRVSVRVRYGIRIVNRSSIGLRVRNANRSGNGNGIFVGRSFGMSLFLSIRFAIGNRNLVSVGLGFGLR